MTAFYYTDEVFSFTERDFWRIMWGITGNAPIAFQEIDGRGSE